VRRPRRLRSNLGFEGRKISVRSDRLRFDDGTEVDRDVVRHPGAVAIVPRLDDGRFVLLRQWRHPVDDVIVEIPAGTLAAGEEPALAARRELREETGYLAESWRPLGTFFTAPGFCDERMHLFLASGLEAGPASPEAGEVLEAFLVAPEEARAMIEDGRIEDAKTIVGLLRVLEGRDRAAP